MKESTKEELKERFVWDKTAPISDNLIRIGVAVLVFGFLSFWILKWLGMFLFS